MAKKILKKLTQKGEAIKFQMERGLSNAQIIKLLVSQNQLSDIIDIDPVIWKLKKVKIYQKKYKKKLY